VLALLLLDRAATRSPEVQQLRDHDGNGLKLNQWRPAPRPFHWTDNIDAAGMPHLAILHNPMAHARVDRIDVTPALDRPIFVDYLQSAPAPDELLTEVRISKAGRLGVPL
jgi:hypothetical protein